MLQGQPEEPEKGPVEENNTPPRIAKLAIPIIILTHSSDEILTPAFIFILSQFRLNLYLNEQTEVNIMKRKGFENILPRWTFQLLGLLALFLIIYTVLRIFGIV